MADVPLWPLAIATAGGFLLWVAVEDPPGGIGGAFSELVAGNRPTPGTPPPSSIDALAVSGSMRTDAGAIAGSAAAAGGVVGVAQSYLGTPYRWGGADRTGIDCSGLTMVAYKQARGISLPHDCTGQTRRGKAIPRNSVMPGDLVAYGSPARYPHIAIAVDSKRMIHAPTWGRTVEYGNIDMKLDGGPTIFRIEK